MPISKRPLDPSQPSARDQKIVSKAPPFVVSSRALAHRWVRRLTLQSHDGGVRTPAAPPECPAGWQTGPPDFVGVGGQRCGTTRWFRLIVSHPEVATLPAAKERHYFDRFYQGAFTDADVKSYYEHFPRHGDSKTGEWTPLYANSPWVPKLLSRAAPEARLLMLVRDPVARLVSGLQHNVRLAREQGMPLSRLAPVEAFSRGLYHAQLTNLLAYFDRSQILLLQYERCSREARVELRRTFEFLGLRDTDFLPPELDLNPNLQSSKPSLDPDTRDSYARAYREDVIRLAKDFPQIDLGLWPNFADLAG
jgi:Sulfotransferase domain